MRPRPSGTSSTAWPRWRAWGRPRGSGVALVVLGWALLTDRAQRERGRELLQRAHHLGEALGDQYIAGMAEYGLGLYWRWTGQTEIAPLATALQPEDALRKPGSVGKATLNVETRVVDAAMRDVRPGEVGEIVHRSPQLLQGYYRDEARTAEAFAGGWFHSGDLATVDEEGYITIVDRKKDMIKSGGENVASREVEEVVYQLPAVAEVAVVGLPHPLRIEAVTAIVVPRAGHALTEAAVIAHCRQQLAGFKVPKAALLVESLPRNPSGKILKRSLRDQHAGIYQVARAAAMTP